MTPILYKHRTAKGRYILVTNIDPDGLIHYVYYNEVTREIIHCNGYRLSYAFYECDAHDDPVAYKMMLMLAL